MGVRRLLGRGGGEEGSKKEEGDGTSVESLLGDADLDIDGARAGGVEEGIPREEPGLIVFGKLLPLSACPVRLS